MKCIQFPNGEVVRVSDSTAHLMVVRNIGTRYVSKEAWKQQGRQYIVAPRKAKV